MTGPVYSQEMANYFSELNAKKDEIYELAGKARAMGFDP